MANDKWLGSPTDRQAPGRQCFAVTKSDVTDFAIVPRYFQVGTGGVVALVGFDDTVVNWTVPDGGYIMCTGKRINSTNTTADLIVGII